MRPSLATAVLLVALLPARAPAQLQPTFPVPLIGIGAGSNTELAAADLDLDGRTDLVVFRSQPGEHQLAFLRALAAGGFAAPQASELEHAPGDLAVGDVNGNGWPDVVSAAGVTQFAVSAGVGNGNLLPAVSYWVGGQLHGVATGDVDDDGLADVASTSNEQLLALNVNLADGTGGFLATLSTPLTAQARDLELADFDGDGHLDAAYVSVLEPSVALNLALGDGAGGFGPPLVVTVPNSPKNVVVRDLDGDGDLDLATPCALQADDPAFVAVARGDGAGGLLPVQLWETGPDAAHLAAGDLDGDGAPDLVTAGDDTHRVSVLQADGAGGFLPPQRFETHDAPAAVALLDATADGLPDVVSWSALPGTAAVLAGDGAGSLLALERHVVGANVDSVIVADLDVDGRPDLLAATSVLDADPSLALLLADGAGGFLPPVIGPFTGAPGKVFARRAGDVGGAGAPDLVLADEGALAVAGNDGAGGVLPAFSVPGSGTVQSLQLGDMDGDGLLDAVAANGLPASAVLVFAGDGAGLAPPSPYAAGSSPRGLALGDLDEDGWLDVVTACYSGAGGLLVLPGDGAGGLLRATAVATATQAHEVVLADLDLDGHLDATVLHVSAGVATLHGNGAGGLGPATLHAGSIAKSPGGLEVADVDGDGWPDAVLALEPQHALAVRRNDGAGGLLVEEPFAAGHDVGPLALADLDGDHRPDLVSGTGEATDFPGRVNVHRNAAAFTWTDLGEALDGTAGPPRLHGTGSLLPGSPGDLRLLHARPSALAVLFVSATSAPAAFKGGTLVAFPPLVQFTLATDAAGMLTLPWAAWPSFDPGQDWYFQCGIADPAAPHGAALSNALKAVEPAP
jgi:hypothetical protein